MKNWLREIYAGTDIYSDTFEDIDNQSFREFVTNDVLSLDVKKIEEILNCKNVVKGWETLFEIAEKNLEEIEFDNENLFMDIYNEKMKECDNFDTI